jgi:hypothetical protein
MGNTISHINKSVVGIQPEVPEVRLLDIPDARYAQYDLDKKQDIFSNLKRDFENHVRNTPEQTFIYKIPIEDGNLDDKSYMNPFMIYSKKLCKEAQKKNWKCSVATFGDTVKISLDK